MSSSIDKEYGELYIFGERENGYVDLRFSSHKDEFDIENISREQAEKMINAWYALQDKANDLYGRLRDVAERHT